MPRKKKSLTPNDSSNKSKTLKKKLPVKKNHEVDKKTVAKKNDTEQKNKTLKSQKHQDSASPLPLKQRKNKKTTSQTQNKEILESKLKLEHDESSNLTYEEPTDGGKTQQNGTEKVTRLTQKWMNLYRRSKNIKSVPYSMRNQYEAKTAIHHKILGWGYILANKNDRLEVLFKDGVRYLISNYC